MSDERDEISFGPELSPGVRVCMRRTPSGEVRHVAVTALSDGVPLAPGSEVATVGDPSPDGWHKLNSLYKTPGPAQVATPKYREGYDRIWGGKQKVGEA